MNKRETYLKRLLSSKNIERKKVLIVLLSLLCITVAVLRSSYVNVSEMEKQLEQNLEDVAKQNAEVLHSRMHAQYELLIALSKELEGVTPDTIKEKLEHFKIFLDEFSLKRFAYCFMDGMTYSSDGGVEDLSYRDFFVQGREGKGYITGVLTDALKEEHTPVNVMTIPVWDENGNVSGVFGLAYNSEEFNQTLQIESFESQGYSCIINENGEIMAALDGAELKMSSNIFTDVLADNTQNTKAIENLQQQIEQKAEGSGTLYLTEKSFYYCIPVELMNGDVTWYILTIIPEKVLSDRVIPIQMNQYTTSFFVVLCVLIGAVLVIFFMKEQHKRMISYAYEDFLTGGPNFTKFCLDMENRENKQGYLIAMDIANFDNIMIVAGKEAADAMIKQTWHIIADSLRKEELAGHVSEEMFLMFLCEENDESLLQRMEQISGQISEAARKLCVHGILAEYGIYAVTGAEKINKSYSRAKLAKEYAATKADWHYAFYNEVDRVQMQKEKQLEERFPEALENHEFEVWYQPKYSASGYNIVGSEALVRWRTADGEMISPGAFIPLFEKNGMIMKLDEYMFRMVCEQQKKWLDEGKKIYPVSINVSRASLYRADIEQRYSEIMKEYGIDSEYIQLEVTETVMGGKQDICELLNKFRQKGIKILMDDFGTGYSSLNTLNTQCFDTLKLDKSLIDHIGDKDGETLLYHVIKMGQQLGLHITAEGVEKEVQLQFLQNLQCDDIQGFYFSKPLPQKEYENILNNLKK